MPSIVNGLFAGRSGIASHGNAIAVAGDNISNASTPGFKANRAEFESLIAGDGVLGRQFGSGSSTASVAMLFDQGTLEFTGRPLDLGISGTGYFVLAKEDQRFYSRAGNFKVDSSGFIVNPGGLAVLGFPANGSGALEPLNVNTIEQSAIETTEVTIAGNVNASANLVAAATIPVPGVAVPPTVTYANLNQFAEYSTVVDTFDSLGERHPTTLFFFHTGVNEYTIRAYVNNEDVDAVPVPPAVGLTGYPRFIGEAVMTFGGDGRRNPLPTPGVADFTANVAWSNGADASAIEFMFSPLTQFSSQSNILSISQDGTGVGAVQSISVGTDGKITALLSNGQQNMLGQLAMASFSNQEGLGRQTGNVFTESAASGAAIIGRAESGALGSIKSGTLELSTVDIASEFVKIITLQRGFQASSRLITTINQLLNEIIQLA
ncbi:MAG: flagellar hook protein FlgE [Pseudomonadota bacterium]